MSSPLGGDKRRGKNIMNLRELKQDKFLKALRKNGGFIIHAAKAACIHRTTHQYWLKTDATYKQRFEEAYADAIEAPLDDVESVLLEKAKLWLFR